MRVLPIEGLPPDSADAIAETLAEALRARGIAASTSPAMRNARLLQPALITGGSEPKVQWDLFETDGRVRESVVTDLPRPGGTATAALAPVLDAVEVSLIPPENRTPEARNASLEIGPIAGAPGNGNAALRKAAAYLFDRAGLDLAADGAEGGLILTAAVAVEPFDPESDLLTINWSIVTPDGEEVGRLAQENPVPKRAVSNDWGPLAFEAVYGLIESVRAVQVAYGTTGS